MNKPQDGGWGEDVEPPKDLVDFHLRWRQFRPLALGASDAAAPQHKEVLDWLIRLADRVGEVDLE